MLFTVGELFEGSKSDAILGQSDFRKFLDFQRRAIELAAFKANYAVWLGTLDVCSDECGIVTLPYFVGTVLQVNVGGSPTMFRNPWYGFHINGKGDGRGCGPSIGYSDDLTWSPTFRDLKEWSMVAVICEDAIDGNGSLSAVVEGETMDANNNPKMAITIPPTGPSSPGVRIPLIVNWASTDPANTYFRKITRVTMPVTRGYKKLVGFPIRQMAQAVTLGYYAPNETTPTYRRIRVGCACKSVRIKYRRASLKLENTYDLVPLGSYQAALELLKSIRLADSNNVQASEAYLARAVRLLNEVESVENATPWSAIQVDPSFGVGCLDWR